MKCRVQWVCNDRSCLGTDHRHVEAPLGGLATPDDNDAVGYAVPYAGFGRRWDGERFVETEGRSLREHLIPICAEHLRRKPSEGWLYLPFPQFSDEVRLDERLAEVLVVVSAVRRAFPKDAGHIESTLRCSTRHGGETDHYSFLRGGMYVGVEPDGYIHT